jgi:hypothetical protein
VPILRELPPTHYTTLNDRYSFYSASPEHEIQRPLPSKNDFPLYFVGDLHICLNGFHFWKNEALMKLADSHGVRVASSVDYKDICKIAKDICLFIQIPGRVPGGS